MEGLPEKCTDCKEHRVFMDYPYCAHKFWNWKLCSEMMILTRENQHGPLPVRCPLKITYKMDSTKETAQPKFMDIPEDGKHMSIEEFMNGVFDGKYQVLTGQGFQATKFKMTDIPINACIVKKNAFDWSFSSVVWIPNKI